jgi:hypothetical protein
MKTRFLIATAAAALLTGSAFAQGPTPSTSQTPSAGASGSMNSGSSQSGNSVDTKGGAMHKQGGTSGAATTGAGASTETNKADDFKTKGASDDKHMQKQRGAQDRMHNQKGAQDNRSDKRKSETTGQAPSTRSGSQSDTNAQQRNGASGAQTGQSGQSRDMNRSQTQDNQRGERSGDNARSGGSTNVNVNLSTEQRTRIKEVIVKQKSAPRVANVNFSLSVGTTVPRTVKHVVVPQTIVEIHPAWRGFHYFMVGDEIVIVDPATLEIVAVIEA